MQDSSRTSLEVHGEYLESGLRYMDITLVPDLDEVNPDVTHTQEPSKVGYYTNIILFFTIFVVSFYHFRYKESRNGWQGLGMPNEDFQHLYDVSCAV